MSHDSVSTEATKEQPESISYLNERKWEERKEHLKRETSDMKQKDMILFLNEKPLSLRYNITLIQTDNHSESGNTNGSL